jgi:branched-chain amino acid transport system permease protein
MPFFGKDHRGRHPHSGQAPTRAGEDGVSVTVPALEATQESSRPVLGPGLTRYVLPAVVVVALGLLPLLVQSLYTVHVLIMVFFYVIAALSVRVIVISGQFPLGHAAFMGIGAYSSGMASKWLGLPPQLTIPVAAIVTMLLGVLVAYSFSRLRALYYAMGSLFLGVAIVQIIEAGGKWTGGYSGLSGLPSLFGNSKIVWFYVALGLMVLTALALYRFESCRIGTNLKAISQSHLVAASVGINEAKYRILAVAVGSFFVGLAGAGYGHYMGIINTNSYNFMATMWLFMYVLVGGVGSFVGPIAGTFVLVLIPEYFRSLKTYSPFVSAGILFLVVYLMPGGLVGLVETVLQRARNWRFERTSGAARD